MDFRDQVVKQLNLGKVTFRKAKKPKPVAPKTYKVPVRVVKQVKKKK